MGNLTNYVKKLVKMEDTIVFLKRKSDYLSNRIIFLFFVEILLTIWLLLLTFGVL